MMLTSLGKRMIKGTDERPREETHRARTRRVPSVGVSVPLELGACCHLDIYLSIRSPLSGMRSETNIRTRDPPNLLSLGELQALCQEPGVEMNAYVFCYLVTGNCLL